MDKILILKNASFSYNSNKNVEKILNDTSYSFNEGTLYSIVAPSGTGKTTLLSLLSGIETMQEGSLLFNKKDVLKDIGLLNYRRKYCSIIFQAYNLIPYMNALDNVTVALRIQRDKKYRKKSKRKDRAIYLLESMGLTEKQIYSSVLTLSGGQQQRVAIARAIASNAPIIFADEPTGNLDKDTSVNIINILTKLAHESNKCIIVVTHDEKVSNISDVTLTILDQKIVKIG